MNKNSDPAEGKRLRQQAIVDAVRSEPVATQDDIVRALKRKGIEATQVSVSRDVAELGLVKAAGGYRLGTPDAGGADSELPLRTWLKGAAAAGPNLLVLKCEVGTAQRVGLAVDQLRQPEIVGTVAGDDTVFVATASGAASRRLLSFLLSRIPAK